jgi:hypothetical protein
MRVDPPRIVYSWPKNSREEVRATLSTYHGRLLADLRVWAADDEGDGDHPTKKGISVRVEQLPKLLEAVQALVEATKQGVA